MSIQADHTLIIDDAAYKLLKSARRRNESFSSAIRRVMSSTQAPKIRALTPAYVQKEYAVSYSRIALKMEREREKHLRDKKAGKLITVKSLKDILE